MEVAGGAATPTPSNQSWLIWRVGDTLAQYSQRHWPTSSQEDGQEVGVPTRAEATAALVGIKNPRPRRWPRGSPHKLRCDMTRTCSPCPIRMGRNRGTFWQGIHPPHCTAMLFAINGFCAGCAGRTASIKTRTSPPPMSWQPPSPGYLKCLRGNDRGA